MGFNKVLLIGRVEKDAEFRWVEEHRGVADFGIAVERTYRGAEGDERTVRTVVPVVAYGPLAERCKGLRAGMSDVTIEGRIKHDQWKDDEGRFFSRHRVVADRCDYTAAAAVAEASPSRAAAPPGEQVSPRAARAPADRAFATV